MYGCYEYHQNISGDRVHSDQMVDAERGAFSNTFKTSLSLQQPINHPSRLAGFWCYAFQIIFQVRIITLALVLLLLCLWSRGLDKAYCLLIVNILAFWVCFSTQMNAGAVMLTDCVFWFIIVPFLANTNKNYDLNFVSKQNPQSKLCSYNANSP